MNIDALNQMVYVEDEPEKSESKTYRIGQRAICKQCGSEIVYVGLYWDHTGDGFRPRHIGIPSPTLWLAGDVEPVSEL